MKFIKIKSAKGINTKEIKSLFTENMILRHPGMPKKFHLQTDNSNKTLGAGYRQRTKDITIRKPNTKTE